MTTEAEGRFVERADGLWYEVDNFDLLDPFLMAIVTPTEQWMYLSSSGALTCGRTSPSNALFPYETDDRLHRKAGITGPLTLVRVDGRCWQPFDPSAPLGVVHRTIAKSAVGDRVRFVETHPELGLTFAYTWTTSERLGFIRRAQLSIAADRNPVDVEVLDGLIDVLPAGVPVDLQTGSSTLVDAYRRVDLDRALTLATFTLEAQIVDTAQPVESLVASTCWITGIDSASVALSADQVRRFRSGLGLEPESRLRGKKGALLASFRATVAPESQVDWAVVGDVGVDHRALGELRQVLGSGEISPATLGDEARRTTDAVVSVVTPADAIQSSGQQAADTHHFANVVFNVMRGGVFLGGHGVELDKVAEFIGTRNRPVARRFAALVQALPPDTARRMDIDELRRLAGVDPDLKRLVNEYLPLSFSRRHGDPSRPWNRFEIKLIDDDGSPKHGYQGNWRDIFQNWDALLHSFPHFYESVVAKFLNASTLDGYNPYRISDEGIDWEVPGEGEWDNIGYWGDHQIAYLYRLLAGMRDHFPGRVEAALADVSHSYADVPYRIRGYQSLVEDPKASIVYDSAHAERISRRVSEIGADGRLVADGEGVHLACLAEKLLVPALAKLSNLVAGAGIWMNTQRPEWNDANNALVGNGVSTVTLHYLGQYLVLVADLLAETTVASLPFGANVERWLEAVQAVLAENESILERDEIGDRERRRILDGLGQAYSDYRDIIYVDGPGGPAEVTVDRLARFVELAKRFVDDSIARSERPDGLHEAYMLVDLGGDTATIERLYPMLEGQVAALSTCGSGTAETIDRLLAGPMYRPDLDTFMLYPDRDLPSFWDKNKLTDDAPVDGQLIYRDAEGNARFHHQAVSARALADLGGDGPELAAAYERTFDHHSFTGRSGSMYGYEGLGSVYWHMVSKLVLAVQRRALDAAQAQAPEAGALIAAYRRVRSGLGDTKTVAEFGSFPTDPHSHSPAHSGAQQPGMTGQVKEGVLIRWGELGVRVRGGRVRFCPVLLDAADFDTPARRVTLAGRSMELDAGTLAFTYCGVPAVYRQGQASITTVEMVGGELREFEADLDRETSADVFARQGRVLGIDVTVSPVPR